MITDGISPYVTGGMQRHSYHLARHLLRLDVKLTLVHCVWAGDRLPSASEVMELLDAPPGSLEVIGFHFPKAGRLPGHYLRESYRYSCEVYTALKDRWVEFDFVYSKGYTAWCLLENKQKGEHTAPVGVKFHGYEMFQKVGDLRGKLTQFLLRPPVVFLNRNANVVFSYGGEISGIIEQMGVSPDRIANIASGIDDEWIAERPLPEGQKRSFLFIGRNERRKGIEELMRCRTIIESSDIEFHWVGPIPEQKQLQIPQCHYHGEIRDANRLREIIDGCQVLVAPSHSEGMPNVILEAMARGLAVIATDVGAVSMLVNRENGRLIQALKVKALKEAIQELIHMPEAELWQLRHTSLERVRRDFKWSQIAQKTLDTIEAYTHKK